MRIVLVDDDHLVLTAVAAQLSVMGHEVEPFDDPLTALRATTPETDLVLADVNMPVLDGFGLARAVSARLGRSPPRTLLTSGEATPEDIEAYPPATVIGLLPKPLSRRALGLVLDLLECTRSRCPGLAADERRGADGEVLPVDGPPPPPLCESPAYACCPHYDAFCGMTLRHWIESVSRTPADAPEALPTCPLLAGGAR